MRLSLFSLLTLALLSLWACQTEPQSMPESTSTPPPFDWQGHRGARGLLPENTIPAFLKALEFPQVRTLELDLAVSKDQILIVSHDPWLSHHISSHPDGQPVLREEEDQLRILEMTYEALKAYDCGLRGNARFPEQQPMAVHKPSLKDMVTTVEDFCKKNSHPLPLYNIEIKSRPEWYDSLVPPPAAFVQLLLQDLQALGIKDRSCVQSFDPEVMRELHRQDATQTNAFLIENLEGFDKNMAKLDFTPSIYSPYFMFVDSSLVQQVHQRGMQLIPWTVNEVPQMKQLMELGVDGIITDYPNRIAEAIQ